MPSKAERRSPCPVSCTLDLIGDKWTLLVIRDLLLGRTTFKEFQASPEGIATNILTNRLQRLVETELISRHKPEGSNRVTYQLTERGESLRPVVLALANWGREHIEGTVSGMKPK